MELWSAELSKEETKQLNDEQLGRMIEDLENFFEALKTTYLSEKKLRNDKK